MKPVLEPDNASRRRALASLAAAGVALAAPPAFAQARAACVLTPQQTEGPFFVDLRLQRGDIRSDPRDGVVRPGAPLALTLRVLAQAGGCEPLRDAIVDVWQCDARGIYSDTRDARGTRYLRGFQRTDGEGKVRFVTIYPGAYPGRAVHVHFKVRTPQAEFTSQLYFDDALTDRVHAQAPYGGARERRTRNADDFIYRQGGRALTLDVEPDGEGYAAAYDVGVRL